MFTYPRFFSKSTADVTRGKCNKTNLCSQRCARLCTGAFCLLAAHPLSFHLSAFLPRVVSFALHIHLSPRTFCLTPMSACASGCDSILPSNPEKTRKILFLVVCLINDVKLRWDLQNCAQQDNQVSLRGLCKFINCFGCHCSLVSKTGLVHPKLLNEMEKTKYIYI